MNTEWPDRTKMCRFTTGSYRTNNQIGTTFAQHIGLHIWLKLVLPPLCSIVTIRVTQEKGESDSAWNTSILHNVLRPINILLPNYSTKLYIDNICKICDKQKLSETTFPQMFKIFKMKSTTSKNNFLVVQYF